MRPPSHHRRAGGSAEENEPFGSNHPSTCRTGAGLYRILIKALLAAAKVLTSSVTSMVEQEHRKPEQLEMARSVEAMDYLFPHYHDARE